MTSLTKSYTVSIAGVKRKLPLFQVAPGVRIALFNLLGDTEIVVAASQALAKKLPKDIDVLVTPEVKSIPLVYELAKILHTPYVVARKIKKRYMVDSVKTEVHSITTGKPQALWIDGKDNRVLHGKRVALVDDVVSTGSTLEGLRRLMRYVGARVIAEAAIFVEGDKKKWEDIISLGYLPIFIDKKN